jgi:hypothetical protein
MFYRFWYIFPVLVSFSKKNVATLTKTTSGGQLRPLGQSLPLGVKLRMGPSSLHLIFKNVNFFCLQQCPIVDKFFERFSSIVNKRFWEQNEV